MPPSERSVRTLEPLRIDLGAGNAIDMFRIPSCTFTMGRPTPEIGWGTKEWPQTPVTIPKAYWLGRCEVTQAQFRALTGLSPSHFIGDDHPVENVGYADIQRFFIALNRREREAGRLPMDEEYRLPTEAEWECAYRAGTDTLYPFGDDPAHLAFYEVVDTPDGTRAVASKRPNPWGFYDMGGNVLELTHEIFGPYPGKPVTDPFERPWGRNYWGMYRGWLAGRGGSWSMGAYASRSTIRRGIPAMSGCYFIGFRVARGQIVRPPEMDR
jgi:formylglycine-generating enzyme required for sulfatase activity